MTTVLNSEATRASVAEQQSRGQWGARDFDKLLADVIPEFDAGDKKHQELAGLAAEAEEVASGVELPEKVNFVRARRMIREALRESGVAGKIDKVVAEMLRT
jgi:hypothetical protein